ncbi:hypothetical protein FB107DRAFT_183480, partial [Schizophyllum commune]
CSIAAERFLTNTSTHLLRYTLKTSSYALERKHSIDQGKRMISNVIGQDTLGSVGHAGLTPSPHDIPPDARDAPADVGSTSSATGDFELALEARRREALKRILTQPEYPTHGAGSKPTKPPLNPNSNSMTRRQAHNSQLSINRLPNELLCAIFLVCGDPSPASAFPRDPMMHDSHTNPLDLKSYSRNAVLLGVVCSRWYHVTHGFPALWTLVDVEYPARYATNILKRCLAHSAGLPLTLWISESVNPRSYMKGEDPDPRFMDLVAANAQRWKEISIELCDRRDALKPLIALPSGAFSILSRARIEFFRLEAQESSLDTQLWRSWLTSPMPSSVDWIDTEHIRSGLAVAPLERLTSIGMHSAEPAMLACVLNTCISLETLLVEIEPHALRRSVPLTLTSPICLPHLRTLMLCGPYNWTPLFSKLILPSLDRLELSRQHIRGRDIESMLQRSCAHLRMLTIFWPVLNQADHILALVRSASLRDLKVLRYQCCTPGGADQGWEDAFDLRPFVPVQVLYTTDANEAEHLYAGLENA